MPVEQRKAGRWRQRTKERRKHAPRMSSGLKSVKRNASMQTFNWCSASVGRPGNRSHPLLEPETSLDASADLLWRLTTNWRAECQKLACSVRREGRPHPSSLPLSRRIRKECVPDVQRRSRGSATLPRRIRKECVPDVQRRSRGSATLPRRIPKNVFQTCNTGRCRTLPTEGIEPTHCCQYWILSPARLPIPPRRLFARRQLLIRLHPNASANDAISQLLRRRIPVSDLFNSPTSVLGYQRIVILGQNIQYLQILTCSYIP